MYRFERDRPPESLLVYMWWIEPTGDNRVAAQMTENFSECP